MKITSFKDKRIVDGKIINDRYIRGMIYCILLALIMTPFIFIHPIVYIVILSVMLMLFGFGASQFIKNSFIFPNYEASTDYVNGSNPYGNKFEDSQQASNKSRIVFNVLKWLNDLSYHHPKLCTECYYLGFDSNQETRGFIIGIIYLIIGLALLLVAFVYPLVLIGSYIVILFGSISISLCFIDSKKCPQCKKKAMINLDSDLAHIIIQQKNLNLPVENIHPRLPLINQYFIDFIAGVLMVIIGIFYYYLYQYLVHIHS